MKNINDIINLLGKKVEYPKDVIDYHVRRIASKLEYAPIVKEIYTKEDAEAIELISYRFFEERKRRERMQAPATALMAKIEPESTAPQTKPLPVIKNKRWKFFAK